MGNDSLRMKSLKSNETLGEPVYNQDNKFWKPSLGMSVSEWYTKGEIVKLREWKWT